jgi:hypothetical protein
VPRKSNESAFARGQHSNLFVMTVVRIAKIDGMPLQN